MSGGGGTAWSGPVLGEAYRSRRCMSASSASAAGVSASATAPSGAKKSSTSARLPKTPRPSRTLQMFACVKRGVQDCIRLTNADILRLRQYDVDSTSGSSPSQSRIVEVEKHIKQAERHRKRLEFHLFKLEELEDSYSLHQQLREGAKTMARAFRSHPGSSRKSSMQNVERGHKECTQTLCAIEAQLENLLGSFHFTMAGLFGFARLVPGDNCEMQLRYGNQKWRCKGKIGDTSQLWEPQSFPLKAVISDVLSIRVAEVRSFGKDIVVGEKNCDTVDLFKAQRQSVSISLNATGSVKLGLVVKWIALDGIEEYVSVMDVPRRMLPSPRRQLPIRSMIEGDDLEIRWQNEATSSPSRAANRFSMPVFPASFSAPISSVSGVGSGLSPCRSVVPVPRCGVTVTVAAAEAARRLHGGQRPCSDVVTTSVSDRCKGEPLTAPRSRSVGTLSSHSLQPLPSPPPQTRPTLCHLIADLQTALQGLQGRHPSLHALMDQLAAVDQLLKKNTAVRSHQSSSESILIENALEAFSFLDCEDYIVDESVVVDTSPSMAPGTEVACRDVVTVADLTLKTTDSGIGSIAQRPTRRSDCDRWRQLVDSQVVSGTSSVDDDDDDDDDEPMSAAESTGLSDVDVALTWHLARSLAVVQSMNPSTENSAVMELGKHTLIIERLLEIAAETDLNFDELPGGTLADTESAQFWRHCAASEHVLFCSSESFVTQLRLRLSSGLDCRSVNLICDRALAHLLGDMRRDITDRRFTELLSQTVTLHWLTQVFKDHRVAGIDDYVTVLQLSDSDDAGAPMTTTD